MSYTNLTLLVSSCDKYSACWQPFCHGINKYWPEHPPLYFIGNHLDAPCGTTLKLGDDQGWAKNLLQALELVPTDYVLYAQEDYWLQAPVVNQHIIDYLSYLESGTADYIRLYPAPGPDMILKMDERLGIIAQNSHYRASLQMSLWRKQTLKSLMLADETPWQFEVKGSRRSQEYPDRFWCVTRRRYGVDYVFTAIVNGYWSDLAYIYAMQEGIKVDFTSLPEKVVIQRIKDKFHVSGSVIKKRTKKVVRNLGKTFRR